MGMDSYLFKTKRSAFTARQELKKKAKEIYTSNLDEINRIGREYTEWQRKYYTEHPELRSIWREDGVRRKRTIEEQEHETAYRESYGRLSGDYLFEKQPEENPVKLGYWRKPYPLHQYIVEHIKEPGVDDNCNEIELPVNEIKRMLSLLKTAVHKNLKHATMYNPFAPGEYWDKERTKETITIFEKALEGLEEDEIIYYWAWY